MTVITSDCFSTVLEPSEELILQFTSFLLHAITDNSDILIINPTDGLIRIEEELDVALTLLDISFPESTYIEYSLAYDTDTDEFDFLPLNSFTQILVDAMRNLEL